VVFRARCGRERFERLFDRVVEKCREEGLLEERVKIVDAISIEGDVAIPNTVNLLRQGRRVIIKRIISQRPEEDEELLEYFTRERLHEKPKERELKEEICRTREFVEKVRGRFGDEVPA